MSERRKRPASEPVDVLVSPETDLDAPAKRPLSLTLGGVFVFARALAGVAWIAGFSLLWKQIIVDAEIEADIAPFVYWLVVGASAIGVLVLVVLAWAILRGSNLARVLVMLGLAFSTITAAIGYFASGEQITIRTTLVTLALDILVLLALSSRDARAWTRSPHKRARENANVLV